MNKLFQFANRVISSVEASKHPYYYYVFVFVFSVLARNFLEVLAYGEVKLSDWYAHLHYSTYYIALVIFLLLALAFVTGEKVAVTGKVILTFIPIIIICPIIDLVLSYGFDLKQTLGYLSPELHGNFFSKYFLYFGNSIGVNLSAPGIFKLNMGPSIGYRAEVFFVLVGFGIYIGVKTKSLVKSLIGVLLIYTLIYFFCSTPFVLKNFLKLSPYAPQLVPYYLLLSFIGLIPMFIKAFPKESKMIFNDFRWLRLAFYELIFLFGVVYGLKEGGVIRPSTLYQGVFVLISIFFLWKHAVMVNNIEDITIDKVSNSKRPLITKAIDLKLYQQLAWWMLGLGLVYALYADIIIWYFLAIFSFNYFIYSAGPIRLKRVPIISKLPIALNILLLFILGNVYTGVGFSNIPVEVVLFIVLGGTLALNIIDIKDFQGDKKAGIKTLPVLIGLKPAKLLLGILFLGGHLLGFIFTIKNETYFILVVLGVLQLISITSKNYSDKRVVGLFLVSILCVIVERFI